MCRKRTLEIYFSDLISTIQLFAYYHFNMEWKLNIWTLASRVFISKQELIVINSKQVGKIFWWTDQKYVGFYLKTKLYLSGTQKMTSCMWWQSRGHPLWQTYELRQVQVVTWRKTSFSITRIKTICPVSEWSILLKLVFFLHYLIPVRGYFLSRINVHSFKYGTYFHSNYYLLIHTRFSVI